MMVFNIAAISTQPRHWSSTCLIWRPSRFIIHIQPPSPLLAAILLASTLKFEDYLWLEHQSWTLYPGFDGPRIFWEEHLRK